MYTALYRRYRPSTFDEMVGQEHIVKILSNQIKTGATGHAYLFCGTRGTGKTSAARIFAKGVNCLSKGGKPCGKCMNCKSIQKGIFFDVIEIDAASNNGVENVRELRESVKYPPAAGKCKVYIIDEVHMLSNSAFNALLKTLEEPPEYVIFIMATTEPHKLPATILSRCLRLDFKRIPEEKIKNKLRSICEELEVECEEGALSLIAANGDGSVRDSLSILEQCLSTGEKLITRKDAEEILGTVGEELFIQITDRVIEGDAAGAFQIIDIAAREGKDMRQFIRDWIMHFRNLMLSKFSDRLEDLINMSCENAERIKGQGMRTDIALISAAIAELSATANRAKFSTQPRTQLELAALKLSTPSLSEDMGAILDRIERLEKKLEQGYAPAMGASVKAVTASSDKTVELIPEVTAAEKESDNALDVQPEDPGFFAGIEPAPEPEDIPPWEAGFSPAEEEPIPGESKPAVDDTKQMEPASETVKPAAKAPDAKEDPAVLWNKTLAGAKGELGGFAMFLGGGVEPLGVTEDRLTVKIESVNQRNIVEQNIGVFEKHLSQVAGRKMKLVLGDNRSSAASGGSSQQTIDQLQMLLNKDIFTVKE